MDEYVLRGDILSALHSGTIDCGMVNAHTYFKLKELSEKIDRKIENVPAADVAPVIRCKDCDLWNEWDHSGRESLGNFRCSCAYWSVEDGPVFFTAPTDFCSYAEPKEEP